jgi:hypothetical protein
MSSTPPETTQKFTPEQRQRLGQVYAMILRWNREDDLQVQQAGQAVFPDSDLERNAVLAEISGQEN